MTKELKKIPSISVKTLGYSAKDLRKLSDGAGQAIFLARIGGIVVSHFIGESKFGEWVGFKGDFTALTKDGDAFEASTAFLPATVANALVAKLDQGQVEIEVLADVFVVETDKNASGYAYMCEPVLTESADKRKQDLNKRIMSGKLPAQLTLAAPAAATTNKKAAG